MAFSALIFVQTRRFAPLDTHVERNSVQLAENKQKCHPPPDTPQRNRRNSFFIDPSSLKRPLYPYPQLAPASRLHLRRIEYPSFYGFPS